MKIEEYFAVWDFPRCFSTEDGTVVYRGKLYTENGVYLRKSSLLYQSFWDIFLQNYVLGKTKKRQPIALRVYKMIRVNSYPGCGTSYFILMDYGARFYLLRSFWRLLGKKMESKCLEEREELFPIVQDASDISILHRAQEDGLESLHSVVKDLHFSGYNFHSQRYENHSPILTGSSKHLKSIWLLILRSHHFKKVPKEIFRMVFRFHCDALDAHFRQLLLSLHQDFATTFF